MVESKYSFLDEVFDGIATENGLLDMHGDLDLLEDLMHKACHSKNIRRIEKAFQNYKELTIKRLENEESVMMACTVNRANQGKAKLREIMIEEILNLVVNSDDFKFFIQYANRTLDKYDGRMSSAREFDHSLWGLATRSQWYLWNNWIEASLTKARYAEVQASIYPDREREALYYPDKPAFRDDEADC